MASCLQVLFNRFSDIRERLEARLVRLPVEQIWAVCEGSKQAFADNVEWYCGGLMKILDNYLTQLINVRCCGTLALTSALKLEMTLVLAGLRSAYFAAKAERQLAGRATLAEMGFLNQLTLHQTLCKVCMHTLPPS